ncbi:fimbrial protein [Klebsiella spallanzanii]|uniref:fimbrial protein n=1 Tax=Klebsiella spallanzanii TaxID=2587528 RepID=UPI0011579858|nr:hypothetical protein [Klebsiella spallanzanii]VUS79844.1 hypothetical protein SB6419_01188 [Klebsiella spallanzanii]
MLIKYNIAKFTENWKIWVLALLVLLPLTASATITCTGNLSGRTDYINQNVPVLSNNVTVSALRDLPTGSVIFRQYISNTDLQSLGVKGCESTIPGGENLQLLHAIDFDGSRPAVIGNYKGMNVYSTGISGIGMVIAITFDNNSTSLVAIPYINTASRVNTANFESSGFGVFFKGQGFELLLVKMGNISPGIWNVPINLPAIVRYTHPTNSTDMTKDYGYRWHINGSVNVVAGTCQTPDITVPMGVHSLQDSTTTGWVDFNINLLNCPPMYGRYNRNSPDTSSTAGIRWNSDSDYTTAGPDTANSISFLLNPVSGYQTLAAGGECAALTNDTDMAKGMCLEIQNRDAVNVLTSVKAHQRIDAKLALLQTIASYAIPLRARYARNTQNNLRAGKADTAVEFTINYQ